MAGTERSRRYLRARQPAAARAMARVPVRPAGAALSRAAQLRHRSCSTAGSRLGEGGRPCLISPSRNADLRAALRAREPHRQRADPRSRPGARQPRAAALGQQSDDGRGLFRGDQGRRRGGRDHAAAARQGAVLSARQGQDRAGAVRRAARRRDGEDQGAVAPDLKRIVYWGEGSERRPRSDDAAARLRAFLRLRHRRATTSA